VLIQVDKASVGGDKRKITIYGKFENDVEAATEEILIERAFISIENHLLEYVCGYNDANLEFFQGKSSVVQLAVEQNHTGNFDIVAVGTRTSVEDLRSMVQTHINLFGRYQ